MPQDIRSEAEQPSVHSDGSPTLQCSIRELGRAHTRTGFLGWLWGTLPTALVLVVLIALGYWGHHTGWKLPKFSELNGTSNIEKDDWCSEHDVPESICVECKAKKFPQKDYGWCKKHGIHNCVLDHPDVAQLEVPPQVTQADLARAETALALIERTENNSKCPLYRRRVQFASVEALKKVDVDVALVQEQPMVEVIPAHGEITWDQTRVARISSRVQGTAWRIYAEVGQKVKASELLGVVDAAEVGRAKADFILAAAAAEAKSKLLNRLRTAANELKSVVGLKTAYVERVKKAVQENLMPQATLQEAEGSLSDAQLQAIKTNVEMDEAEAQRQESQIRQSNALQILANLGLNLRTEDVTGLSIDRLTEEVRVLGFPEAMRKDPGAKSANLLPILAPFDGVVVSRDVVVGEVLDTTKPLFVVADVSRMWLVLNVRQEDSKYVSLGQPVRFTTDSGGGHLTGQVTWISTTADEKTRTVRLRAELPNNDGRLRASTFGAGQIALREEKQAVVVPNEAVHWDGSCYVVFVRNKDFFKENAPKVFHPRTVRVGAKDDQYTEIIAGVLPGEVVASKGSAILRASLLKNNLGAG
jgi:membrane fusion protein, heavy metal efflux system